MFELSREKLFLIAEIGANHDGDPAKAHRMIDLFADAGADAVKFQTYSTDVLVADVERPYTYGPPGRKTTEPIGEMFARLSLPRKAHRELFDHARERGVVPFTTLFDPGDVEFALGLGQELFKISSGDVNYRQLLEAVAAVGRPVVISGGKCTIGELDRAIEVLERGSCPIGLMHCVAAYPTPIESANLRVLETYQRQYPDVVPGFSDHTVGITCSMGAVALGARLIEKHVTYDRDAAGPDHWFSSNAEEFAAMVEATRDLLSALGSPRKRILDTEEQGAKYGRRSIVAARDLPEGHMLKPEDLAFLRPGTGIDPFDVDRVIGRKLMRAVAAGAPVEWSVLG